MSKFRAAVLLLIAGFFICSCKEKIKTKPLFDKMENTGIRFDNEVHDQEINNSFLFRNFYNGGGVGIGDLNNDGWADVLMTSNMGENRLYLNKGNWKFEDITAKSGMKQDSMWSTGVVMVDINNDGWLDMYVCNSGNMQNGNRRNKLYINNHDLTFTESAAAYGLDISAYSTQASFFDYDLDGDLDCFLIANSPMPVNTLGYTNKRDLLAKDWPVEKFVRDGGDHLYKNEHGKFREVTKEAGIHGTLMSFGLGVSVGDINNDGYPDIYVSNDSYERDYLYINQRNGTFKDDLESCMKQISFSSMGADMADINNDGNADIFTTDMLPGDDYRLKTLGAFDNIDLYRNKVQLGLYHQFMKNCLQLNNGDGTFSEISNYSDVVATDWSWGALIFDADNDGLNDLFVCNGVNKDVTNLDFMTFFANDVVQQMVLTGKKDNVEEVLKHIPVNPMPNKAFRNMGGLRFADASEKWGLAEKSFSNGAAYGDLDNDGDLDLIVNNENMLSFVYKNNSAELKTSHFIGFKLAGDSLNTFAIGSKIKVYSGNQLFYRELVPSRGFQSSMDYKQIIGLGHAGNIDSVVITWPDQCFTKMNNPRTDSVYFVRKSSDKTRELSAKANNIRLFDSVPSSFDKHAEDDYIDFYYERNIPEILSREGPKATTADINGDGLMDLFIGGTKDHPGQIYTQNKNGKFEKKEEKVFYQFMDFEDGAALFFDADNDGDADLFIGPAGNNQPEFTRMMQDRLLINDGAGNFSLQGSAFPSTGFNVGSVAAYDFDHDGDLDLYIGSRCVGRDYGATPKSFIFVNDGKGNFKDAGKENPAVAMAGMITGSAWADVAGDSAKELIVVGEWMEPKIFSFDGKRFSEVKTNLAGLFGLWQTVAVADINGDGKTDLVLGNIGENFYLHPDRDNPVKLWRGDFDNSGDIDKLLTRTVDGKDKPVFLKGDIQDQVPSIKKGNLKNHDFAQKSIQELFPGDALSKADIKTFNFCSSVVAITMGGGKFDIQKLPVRGQLSCMTSIICTDLNGDGKADIISGGNRSGFPPQLEKLDASYGDVFINKGKNGFEWQPSYISGIRVEGEVRDMVTLETIGAKYLLFLRNDDFPKLYRYETPKKN